MGSWEKSGGAGRLCCAASAEVNKRRARRKHLPHKRRSRMKSGAIRKGHLLNLESTRAVRRDLQDDRRNRGPLGAAANGILQATTVTDAEEGEGPVIIQGDAAFGRIAKHGPHAGREHLNA